MNELKTAMEAAVEAGKRIMEIYNKDDFLVEQKEENGRISELTEADTQANAIIMDRLRKYSYPILTEEEKDDGKRLNHGVIWIIDPLDGTKEFVKKLGEFTVNIALVNQAQPAIGVIYVPVKEELYYAVKGQGAFKINEEKVQLHVTQTSVIKDMTLSASRSHMSPNLQKFVTDMGIQNVMNSGSSLKGCLVATGQADAYIRMGPISEWDICAMDLIVKEAGGRMSDLHAKPMHYNKSNILFENGFISSNSALHDKLLEAIKSYK